MIDWSRALRAALTSGATASLGSAIALALAARREHRGVWQPLNATSHWLHGDAVADRTDVDLARTGVGYATNHAASIFWAVIFEAWRQSRGPARPRPMLRDASVMAVIAAAVLWTDTQAVSARLGSRALPQGHGDRLRRSGDRSGRRRTAHPGAGQILIRSVAERAVAGIAAINRWRRGRSESAFLVGVHQPLSAELTLDHLAVTGTIPPALRGRYLKMGANPVRPDHAGHHWFLGDGMVHEIALGPSPRYRNRWIRSRLAAAALRRDPAPGPRHGRNDTVNTNIVPIAGRPFALVEAGSYPVALAPTLDDQRYDNFDGTLAGSFTGHPHLDRATGELHAICYDGGIWDRVRHVVISPEGRVIRELAIPVRDGPCIHDCAITARFVVVLDLPVTFSMRAVLGGHAFPFRWNAAHPARVGLLPRDGAAGDIVWCPADPCFVFHVANAYDDGGRVIMDVIAYDTMFTGPSSGLDSLGHLERWTIDPVRCHVERNRLDDTPLEFPRIDERRFGRPHRIVYTVAVPPDGNTQLRGATRLHRFDVATNTRTEHDFGDGHLPGEFIFIPDGPAEDEGWLMGLVLNVDAGTTDLVILDARRFDAEPVAMIHLPHAIPPGFHGNWFPD